MIVAIDGPSGSGKSTVAKLVSKKLNLVYIDTGAMYRALAYKAVRDNIEIDVKPIEKMLKNTSVDYKNNSIFLDDENVDGYIRSEIISRASSKISALESVRKHMVNLQREISKNNNVVLDGRDIGTNVFPNADYKFFITASIDERANRRYKEITAKNIKTNYETVLNDLKKRDENDTNRKISPLKVAKDARIIDTTSMNIEDVVNYIINFIGGNNVI